MEWFRKMFGFPERSREDPNPFRKPTWDEIIKQRDSQDMQHPPGSFFYGEFPRNDIFIPQEFFGSHFDDMFSQLDTMMRELHQHPAWALPDMSDSVGETYPQSPRDSMLKSPDADSEGDIRTSPHLPHPFHGHEGEENYGDDHQDFSGHGSPFVFSPHSFFDRFIENFGMDPGQRSFDGFSDGFPKFGSGHDPGDHSREKMIKKEDTDIDGRISGDLSKLPEGGPSYSYDGPGTLDPRSSPRIHPESPQPGVKHKFYSKSIVTIRRPDGSVEETKKYTDSTGREEVTVTHRQPDNEDNTGQLLQHGDPMGQVPSVFSWFFRR